MASANERTPLLAFRASRKGDSSVPQTSANVIGCLVGTGVLGIPYIFSLCGWAPATLCLLISAILSVYCMILLVRCKRKLQKENNLCISSYGDIGYHSFGRKGRYLAETFVMVSQCGGCVAYLIFIGQTLSSFSLWHGNEYSPTAQENAQTTVAEHSGGSTEYALCVFLVTLLQIPLAWLRSLALLGRLSMAANIFNLAAMGLLMKQELLSLDTDSFSDVSAITDLKRLPFVAGVALFSYEGFSLTLSLENSMKEPAKFKKVLGFSVTGVGCLYLAFGFIGYLRYGVKTHDLITSNMTDDGYGVLVKVGLCAALALTMPVMMHPVHETVEEKMKNRGDEILRNLLNFKGFDGFFLTKGIRALSVGFLGALAALIPDFGTFISSVGSTVSSMLALVFPTLFFVRVFGGSVSTWEKSLCCVIMLAGLTFALHGLLDLFNVSLFS